MNIVTSGTKAQCRPLLRAILDADADALCDLVCNADPQLDYETAVTVMHQAFMADVRRNKVGAYMHAGGLASAVFIGIHRAQYGDDGDGDLPPRHADGSRDGNAITIMCSTAMQHDDPRILDVLIDWEPDFRMGAHSVTPEGELDPNAPPQTSIETTVAFFDDYEAPKCAARLRERRPELVDAVRVRFLRKQAEQRLVRVAKRWLGPCRSGRANPPGEDPHVSAGRIGLLEDIIADPGIQVHVLDDYAFTCGFCLLGRPELCLLIAQGEDKEAAEVGLRAVAERALAERSHAAANVRQRNDLRVTHHPLLDPIIEPFAGLRPSGARPHVVIRLGA